MAKNKKVVIPENKYPKVVETFREIGDYELKDTDGETIIKREGYVPSIMSPEENGYGDYIIMNINEHGLIANWQYDDLEYFED